MPRSERAREAHRVANQAQKSTEAARAAARRDIYKDVETLISPGFLTHQVSVGGMSMSMRSLFPGDIFLLKHRMGRESTVRTWKEWAVASSVWMMDGQLLLGQPNTPARVQRSLRHMSRAGIDMLFSVFMGLFNRVTEALNRIEAFCYEDFSRQIWRRCGRQSPATDEFAGIPGVGSHGMNHAQRLWTAYNLVEDDRQQWMRDWQAAKLVASSNTPKGVKRIASRDKAEAANEEERRKRVISLCYERVRGAEDDGSPYTVYRAVSAEELVAEMERWKRGESDRHDQIVEFHKNRIREQQRAQQEAHAQRMAALEAQRMLEGFTEEPTRMVGYTAEQLGEMLKDRPKGARQVAGTEQSRMMDKVVHQEIRPGVLGKDGRARGAGGDPQSLNDRVKGRSVTVKDGGD